tara:strand:- start:20144 stop:20353 length:210 start_codon:yes stop_codon:yes gene_type:complete
MVVAHLSHGIFIGLSALYHASIEFSRFQKLQAVGIDERGSKYFFVLLSIKLENEVKNKGQFDPVEAGTA